MLNKSQISWLEIHKNDSIKLNHGNDLLNCHVRICLYGVFEQ